MDKQNTRGVYFCCFLSPIRAILGTSSRPKVRRGLVFMHEAVTEEGWAIVRVYYTYQLSYYFHLVTTTRYLPEKKKGTPQMIYSLADPPKSWISSSRSFSLSSTTVRSMNPIGRSNLTDRRRPPNPCNALLSLLELPSGLRCDAGGSDRVHLSLLTAGHGRGELVASPLPFAPPWMQIRRDRPPGKSVNDLT